MRAWGAKVYSTTGASVCTGAFLLATAGLLDGRRAVTHWQRCAEFACRFAAVRVEPDPIFVRDGNIWTSAGITAGIDLALALVEEDLGPQVALAVARQLVVFLKRPGGQAQFSATLALQQGDARFERLHAWIADNLRRDLSVASLADAASMSERSFIRHYRRATGMTPARATERIPSRGGSPSARARPAGKARSSALRLRLRGDHAPQLPAPARCDAAGLSRTVLLGLEPEHVQGKACPSSLTGR
jgi:AraC-like DNA-binding protein